MHTHDNDAFDAREPTSKKINRVPKIPLRIHHRWAGDGHDKLYKIGFPVWGVVDDATGKWLDGWVVPSNRFGMIVGYLFLLLVEKYGGGYSLCIFVEPHTWQAFPFNLLLTAARKQLFFMV